MADCDVQFSFRLDRPGKLVRSHHFAVLFIIVVQLTLLQFSHFFSPLRFVTRATVNFVNG